MKISCLPVSIFKDICSDRMDLVDWAGVAKEIGYDGIDISIMFLKNRTPTYLAKLRQGLADVGLPVIMMTTYPDFTHPDAIQRERELLYLQSDVALCSELGVRYLRILAGQAHPTVDTGACVDWVSDAFHAVDAYAKHFDVSLVFENHGKPGAWDNVDFTYDPQNFLRICDRILDTNIRINFDTGNITAHGEDPMEILPKVLDRVETIHVTDMRHRGSFSPTAIGSGVTPNRAVFQYLKANGFDGWLCIEEASGRGFAGVRDAYEYVKTLWDEV